MKKNFLTLFVATGLALSASFITSCGSGESKPGTPVDSVKASDEPAAINKTIKNFYKWYVSKGNEFGDFQIINTKKTYRVNFEETEKLLNFLKGSGYVNNKFLEKWRGFFKERDDFFQKSGQKEGPPEGFEFDPFSYSQGGDSTLNMMSDANWEVTVNGDTATAVIGPVGESPGVTIKLAKEDGKWFLTEVSPTGE